MRIANPIGKKGEDIAVEFLKKKGYKILERNYRKQYAEIDIIALHSIQGKLFHVKQAVLVFVEVKTRTSNSFGSPLEAITLWKLRPLQKLAQYYSMSHPELPNELRIDAVSILLYDQTDPTIEHIENISEF